MIKRVIKRIVGIFLFSYASNSFALLCPGNFNHIDFGLTVDQVVQQCGKAASSKDSTITIDHSPQEWSYFIAPPATPGLQSAGTLKAIFSFTSDGKLINIAVNGIGLGDTTICGGQDIQLGATQAQVKAACGDAAAIAKQSNGNNQAAAQQIKVTDMTYAGNPPVIMHFENGTLVSVK